MPSPDFSPRLRDKIWERPGDEATYVPLLVSANAVTVEGISVLVFTVITFTAFVRRGGRVRSQI